MTTLQIGSLAALALLTAWALGMWLGLRAAARDEKPETPEWLGSAGVVW